MAKRRSDEREVGRTAKRRRQHLYLVFDDWSSGYSIRKVDLSDADPSYGSDPDAESPRAASRDDTEPRLPPAVFRVAAARQLPQYFSSAFGTRIMAMQPRQRGADGGWQLAPTDHVPVFDVVTRGIIWGPRPESDPTDPIYFPVGDRLFALGTKSFEELWPPPLDYRGGEHSVWSWSQHPEPPFKRRHVTSYALHPDGRTIFVSTERRGGAATFTLDTGAAKLEWKRRGKWALPFDGRAHFDTELDAFVGLSKDQDTLGHLCSCEAASSDGGGGQHAARERKLSKETLFTKDPAEKHVGARLVYLGGWSEFCLIQCISIEDKVREHDVSPPRRYMFRLTTFSLKYDKNGDLTTGNSRRVEYCRVPKASTESLLKNPVAFWL